MEPGSVNNNQSTETMSAVKFLKNAEGLLVAIILAVLLWLGQTTYANSLLLTELSVKMGLLTAGLDNERSVLSTEVDRIDGHLDSIWPRLREMKERVQHLESLSGNARAAEPWRY